MNLQELQESKKTKVVKRALSEHYEINIDFDKLSLKQTQTLLSKTKGLLSESKKSNSLHESHKNSAYLKLVMMEQALTDRLNDLRNAPARVVVENEEVQKSQVILAAQDMIDSIQKMLEQVSKMNVEELNAVVDGIKNEFGSQEGDNFKQSVSGTLNTLQTGLTTAKDSISNALGAITGDSVAPMSGMDQGLDMGADGMDMETPPEEPMADIDADMEVDTDVETEVEPEDDIATGRGRR